MKKILIYVDAENITSERLTEFINSEYNVGGALILGKFYGNRNVLGNDVVRQCYSAGFEYVDTFMLINNRKNGTDMKIAVDCISDVAQLYAGDVQTVYIVSADHDFLPLLYKVSGMGVEIKAPFLEEVAARKNCSDVSKYLERIGFNPVIRGCLPESLFEVLCSVAGDEFDTELLRAFTEKKKNKLVRSIYGEYGEKCAELVKSLDVKTFDYWRLAEAVGENSSRLFNIYTQKMYGNCAQIQLVTKIIGGEK